MYRHNSNGIKKILVAALIITLSFCMCSCDLLQKAGDAVDAGDAGDTGNTGNTGDPGDTAKVRADIVTDRIHQTIAGFGASGCWWAQDVGGWDEAETGPILDYLFDDEKGIGLTIYRYNIGAGPENNPEDPWRKAETFETASGRYDWNRDANAVKMIREAVKRGVDTVIMFACSPPGRMTRNGYTSGDFDGKPNFKNGMEEEFARYLVDIAEHFAEEGIPVRYISPLNEPQWEWKGSQEGCRYTTEQIMNVSRALARELNQRGSAIKPSLIDSGRWLDMEYTINLLDALISDPEIGGMMDHFAAHSYATSTSDKKVAAGLFSLKQNKLPLFMTEWCQMEWVRDLGMDAALVLARTVHEDLTILSVASWQSWLAVSMYDYKDGLVYVDHDTMKYYDSKRMWALGNWSRYVRPGYTRIGVDCDSLAVLITAFASPDSDTNSASDPDPKSNADSNSDSGKIVVVVVNTGRETELEINGLEGNYSEIEIYETSESKSLSEVYKGPPVSSRILPAKSVTTFVYR